MTHIHVAIGGLMLLALGGCGGSVDADYEKLGLVDISGTVRLDGQPLEGAVVMFESTDGTFCYGRTDTSGYYTLKLNSEKSGVVPGEKIVRISTTASTGEESGIGEEEDPDAPDRKASTQDRVPDCYNRNSRLAVVVSESDSSVDFDLRSDCTM